MAIISPIYQTQITYVSLKSGLVSKANLLKVFNCYKIEGEGHISYSGKNKVLKVAGGDVVLYYSSYTYQEVSLNNGKWKTERIEKATYIRERVKEFITLTLRDGDVIDYDVENYDFFYMTLDQYKKYINTLNVKNAAATRISTLAVGDDNFEIEDGSGSGTGGGGGSSEDDAPSMTTGGEGSNTYLFDGFDELSKVYGFNQFNVLTEKFHGNTKIIDDDVVSGGGAVIDGNAMYAIPDYGYKGTSLSGYGYQGPAVSSVDFYNYNRKISPFESENTYIWNWIQKGQADRTVILTNFDSTSINDPDTFTLDYIPKTNLLKIYYDNQESDWFDITYQEVFFYFRAPKTNVNKVTRGVFTPNFYYFCWEVGDAQSSYGDPVQFYKDNNKELYWGPNEDQFSKVKAGELLWMKVSDIKSGITIETNDVFCYRFDKSKFDQTVEEAVSINVDPRTIGFRTYFTLVENDPYISKKDKNWSFPISIPSDIKFNVYGEGTKSAPYFTTQKLETVGPSWTDRYNFNIIDNVQWFSALLVNNNSTGSLKIQLKESIVQGGKAGGLAIGHKTDSLESIQEAFKTNLSCGFYEYIWDGDVTLEHPNMSTGGSFQLLLQLYSPPGILNLSDIAKNNRTNLPDLMTTARMQTKGYHSFYDTSFPSTQDKVNTYDTYLVKVSKISHFITLWYVLYF